MAFPNGSIPLTSNIGTTASIDTFPTSSAGLPSGAVWNNGGVLNIV